MEENSTKKASSRRPAATAFKQQQLKAWQPILTPRPVIITFVVLGIIFIPVGVVLLVASNSVVETSVRYDSSCPFNSICLISINVPQTMAAPVYMYYGLDNYYQNHRRYVASRDDQQLRGDAVNTYTDLSSSCEPLTSLDDSSDANDLYLPCGLIAWSMFNDTFSLYDPSNNSIALKKEGIAWSSDVQYKFSNPPEGTQGIRVIPDFTDEDFIVWMRTAGLPNFKKLYRIIETDLQPGNYWVKIGNYYPVSSFDGSKYVILSTTTWIGGKNDFLGWAYIAVGIVALLQGIVFLVIHKIWPRKLGDTKYLDWTK